MKRILLTLWLAVFSISSVMSQINHYVIEKIERDSITYLYMNPKEYERLDDIGKAALLKAAANQYQASSICVVSAHNTELWLLDKGAMKMVDSWNKDSVKALSGNTKKQDNQKRSLQHPWFFNISGSISTDNIFEEYQKTKTYNAYGRIGCYLLGGRWDFALSGIIGYCKPSGQSKGYYNNSIGVDTRLYILKGKAVNPFAGVGVAYATNNGESSVTIPLSAGLSIPINGKGCIDFCYQYNKVTKSAFVFGYTHMHK